jgi:hypothetical protein
MVCTGLIDKYGLVDVLGSYSYPPGPDWGWRITLSPGEDELEMRMFNIHPEGQEDLAVEASYRR